MNIEKPLLNNTICFHLKSKLKNWLIKWILRIREEKEIQEGTMEPKLELSISMWRVVARRSLMIWSLSTFFSDIIFMSHISSFLDIELFLYIELFILLFSINIFEIHFKIKTINSKINHKNHRRPFPCENDFFGVYALLFLGFVGFPFCFF